jgi:HemY protein
MGRVIGVLLVLSVAVALALLMRVNEGNVALLWPPYRVDVSLNLVLLALFALFALLHLLLLALSNAVDLPQRVRLYRGRRLRDAALAGLRDGVIAFNEGRYARAERLVQPALAQPELAGAAALLAARSAHRLHDGERRERWLELAASEKASTNGALMCRAELAVEDQRPTDALEAVARLHSRGARHIQALRIALRAHEQLGDWQAVFATVRQLDKREALHPSLVRGLKIRAMRELIGQRGDDAHGLQELVGLLTSAERDIDEIAESAARALSAADRPEQAAELLVAILDRRLAERLVPIYAALKSIPARDRLRRLEAWRNRHGDHSSFTIAAGRLCAAEGLWGKAEEFLRLAEAQAPGRETRSLLASLFERLGRHDEALRYWRLAAIDGVRDPLVEWPTTPLAASGPAAPPRLPDAPDPAEPA